MVRGLTIKKAISAASDVAPVSKPYDVRLHGGCLSVATESGGRVHVWVGPDGEVRTERRERVVVAPL